MGVLKVWTGTAWEKVAAPAPAPTLSRWESPLRADGADNTIPHLEWTALRWTSEAASASFVTHTSTQGGNALFTFQEAGTYRIDARYTLASSSGGTFRTLRIADSTGTAYAQSNTGPVAANGSTIEVSDDRNFAVNEQFRIDVYHNAGSASGVFSSGPAFASVRIVKIG